jgi:plasmid stability protein
MASIVIRGLDDQLKQQLRLRAASHGRSMESEAKELLKSGLYSEKTTGKQFLASIRAIVEPLGGMELEPYRRGKNPPREVFAPRGTRRK